MTDRSLILLLLVCIHCCLAVETYKNPVVDTDAPDPGVLYHKGYWYMVSTGWTSTDYYPIRRSKDLAHWEHIGYVFKQSTKPSWAVNDYWAPELHEINGKINCYFSARHSNGHLTIGGAYASSPEGPYTAFPNPIVQNDLGVIDVNVGYDNSTGKPYLVWKVDGNAYGANTPIYIAELNKDGSAIVGTPKKLIECDRNWETTLVEGPWIFYHAPYYYLFYSGSPYNTAAYAVGVARSKSITGPYEKAATPVMSQIADGAPARKFSGPGHCSVVHIPQTGADAMVYHAWYSGKVGQSPGRVVLVDRIWWGNDHWPRVGASGTPSSYSLPVPNTKEFATMSPDVRLPPNGEHVNLETSQWSGNCWDPSCTIDGNCGNKFLKIVSGLAGGNTVSLQYSGDSNKYIRHRDGLLYLESNDGSDLFRFDASFGPVPGLKDSSKVSLHAVNYVTGYLRHKDGRLHLDDWDGSDLMASDATWGIKQ